MSSMIHCKERVRVGEHMRVDAIGSRGHFDDAYRQRPCCTANVSMCAVCLNQSTTAAKQQALPTVPPLLWAP